MLVAMAAAHGRRGDWEKVREELHRAEASRVKFSDGDMLRVMLACCHGGVDPSPLLPKLSKSFGFASEVRNHIPHIALTGNIDLAVKLYLTVEKIKEKPKQMKQKRANKISSYETNTNATYLIRPMLRSGAGVDALVAAVTKLDQYIKSDDLLRVFMFEAAARLETHECVSLYDSLVDKLGGSQRLEMTPIYIGNRLATKFKNVLEELPLISKTLANTHEMGYMGPFSYFCKELIPIMLDSNKGTVADTATIINKSFPWLNWSMVSNLLLASLFNLRKPEYFTAAANFVLNINVGFIRPEMWRQSCASAFLEMRDVDEFINIVVGSFKISNSHDDRGVKTIKEIEENLFGILVDIVNISGDNSGQDIVPILEELEILRIGLPRSVGEKLVSVCRDSETVQRLVEDNIKIWDVRDQYWTDQRHQELLEARKKMSRDSTFGKENFKYKFFKMPDNVEDLKTTLTVLEAQGTQNRKMTETLISKLITEDKAEEALSVYKKYEENFCCSATLLDEFVSCLCQHNISSIDIVMRHIAEEDRRIYMSSFMKALAFLAQDSKNTDTIINYIENVEMRNIMVHRGSQCGYMLNIYAARGDAEGMEKLVNCLSDRSLLSPDHVVNLQPLVDVHLVNDDSTSAVSQFVRIARNYQKLPRKFELTNKLIEEGNIEGIQTVLDASIDVIGEEKSLYDLAYCFVAMRKMSQARKLMDTPGLRFDTVKIGKLLETMDRSGQKEAAEWFIHICKNIFGSDLDFLNHKLVTIFQDDPDKVEEIYRNMKNEDFTPSDVLLHDISEILTSHGRTVDFEVKLSGKLDEVVQRALDVSDVKKAFKIVMESINDDTTSLKCKVDFLDTMIKRKRNTEGCLVAAKLANNFAEPEKIQFKRIYHKLLENLPASKRVDFLKTLNPAFRKIIMKKRVQESSSISMFADESDDLEAIGAMNDNDIPKLTKVIKSKNVTWKTKNEMLSNYLDLKNLDNAAEVALAIVHDDDVDSITSYTKDLMATMLKRYQENGQVKHIEKFISRLGPRTNLLLRGHIWVKTSLMKCDPDAYLEMLYTDQANPKKWMVNTEVLLESVANNPHLGLKLVELADQGFVPAAVLAAKMFFANEEFDKMEEYLPLVPKDLLKSKRAGLFDKIETAEKMNRASEAVRKQGMEEAIVENISNSCMAYNSKLSDENLVEVANQVLSNGIKIEAFAKTLVVRLAKLKGFKCQQEARKLVDNQFLIVFDD